jgi:hypothetical protein
VARKNKDNHLSLARRKGWIGFVRSYWEYIKKHDDVNWNGSGTMPKEEKVVQEGAITKTIIKF